MLNSGLVRIEPFVPMKGLAHPHLQTILGDKLPSPGGLPVMEQETLRFPDGDQIVVEYRQGQTAHTFVLGHGLSGNSRAAYVVRLARHLLAQGHSVVLMNHRNCGLGAGLAQHPYHSGRGDDLGRVVAWARHWQPRNHVSLIGYSMSGNAALSLVAHEARMASQLADFAELKQSYLPDFVLAVNPPADLRKSAELINKGLARIYEVNFMRQFDKLFRNLQAKGAPVVRPKFHALTPLRVFDHIYTAPRIGLPSGEAYYDSCSTHLQLPEVSVPTFILTSADDPFVDYRYLRQLDGNRHVHFQVTEHGGHMGYLSHHATPLQDRRWMDYAILEVVRQMVLA